MPKQISPAELDRIVAAIGRYPMGVALDALFNALKERTPRRTLQRRLAGLVDSGRIAPSGQGRNVRYRATSFAQALEIREPTPDELRAARASAAPELPLSPAALELRSLVRRPLHLRKPVGYDIRLLEAYTPNHSSYLGASLAAQLHALGRSSVAEQAPAGTFARDILARLVIDLSWASSRLEGNTYSRLDTERLIELGQAAQGKDALEAQMILNHKAAIEYLVNDASVAVDKPSVLALHALLSDGLMHDAMASGRVRQRVVEIGGSVYRPLALPQRLDELLGIVLAIAAEITEPLEQAFFLMVHLPYLQPFEDINKRTSRLAANIPLVRHNLSPLSFIDVPAQAYVDGLLAVYELGRTELLRDVFCWAYERSCQQYVAVRRELMPPDTFRLRYRTELGAAIQTIVRAGLQLSPRTLAAGARAAFPAKAAQSERERFVALLAREFETLHEGNAIRFGLRPLEYASWLQRQTVPSPGRQRAA